MEHTKLIRDLDAAYAEIRNMFLLIETARTLLKLGFSAAEQLSELPLHCLALSSSLFKLINQEKTGC